jgi:hypothetical protein
VLLEPFEWGGKLAFSEEVTIQVENGENFEKCIEDPVCSQIDRISCDVALDTTISPGRVDVIYEFYVGQVVDYN